MAGIQSVDLPQTIRDTIDMPLSDEQVQEITARCYRYDGDYWVPSVDPEGFWRIVEQITTRMGAAELRSIRETVGYSIEDLTRHLSVSRSIVMKWESGTRPIPAGVAAVIEQLQDDYADARDAALEAKPDVLEVWPTRLDAECWAETGRPSRWGRQIAAECRQEHGTRIWYRA